MTKDTGKVIIGNTIAEITAFCKFADVSISFDRNHRINGMCNGDYKK